MKTRAASRLAPGDICHVLHFGVAKCRSVPGLPHEWPTGHTWARPVDFATIPAAHRCPKCVVTRKRDSGTFEAPRCRAPP